MKLHMVQENWAALRYYWITHIDMWKGVKSDLSSSEPRSPAVELCKLLSKRPENKNGWRRAFWMSEYHCRSHSHHFRSIWNFLFFLKFLTKWPPAAIWVLRFTPKTIWVLISRHPTLWTKWNVTDAQTDRPHFNISRPGPYRQKGLLERFKQTSLLTVHAKIEKKLQNIFWINGTNMSKSVKKANIRLFRPWKITFRVIQANPSFDSPLVPFLGSSMPKYIKKLLNFFLANCLRVQKGLNLTFPTLMLTVH